MSRDIGILNATARPPTEDLREFPEATRRTAGYELRKLQRGEPPDDWRPFPEVGSGVNDSYRLSGRLVPRDVGGKVCESHLLASQFPEEHSQDRSKRRRNRQDTLSRGGRRKEGIEMKFDTESRHRTKAGGNVFLDLGFPPKEAKRLLAYADAQIDEAVRLK